MEHNMEYTSQDEITEQVDLCIEEQERGTNSEEERVIREEQNPNANLENEINDGQNETGCREEMQVTCVNKTTRSFWENARDNTKAAIKCEVKASIVTRAIDIKLQEFCIKREEQEEEIQELMKQKNIINDYLRSELTNRAPLLTELDKTDTIVNVLNERIIRNVERYQQLENRKEELRKRVASAMSSYNQYKIDGQKQSDNVNSKIQEITDAKAKFYLDFQNDTVRLNEELEDAERSLKTIQEKNVEIKHQTEEIEKECGIDELTEMQGNREALNKEINDLCVENLEQEENLEECERKTQLDLVERDLRNTENTFAEKSTSLNANREKVEENRLAESVSLEHLNNIKQSLEEYMNKYAKVQRRNEETKINYEANIQVVYKQMRDLETKLSTMESDIAAVNKEKMDLSTKVTEMRSERNEMSLSENKLKLQGRQLEQELEENRLLLVKYDEQSKSFPMLDSLKATYDKAMEKYAREVNSELQNLQEKKRRLIVELEEIGGKYTAAFKDRQEEFDALMENVKKETVELQEKGEQDLKEAQLQVTTAMDALNAAKANFKRLQQQYKTTIQKRNALGRKENVLLRKPMTKRELPNIGKNQNQPLVGILKNTGVRTPEKKVRFDPVGPNWDTLSERSSESTFNIWNNKPISVTESQKGDATSLFSDLLRNSPPVREKSALD